MQLYNFSAYSLSLCMRRKGFIFFSCGFFRGLSPAVFWCLKAWPSIVPSLTFLESLGGKGVNHSVRIRCRWLGLCALPAGASEYQSRLTSLLFVCEINLESPHTHTHIHTLAVAKAHWWQDRGTLPKCQPIWLKSTLAREGMKWAFQYGCLCFHGK